MKKTNNIRFLLTTGLFLFGLTACSDLLDQKPEGQWTIDDIPGGSFTSQVMALYSDARGYNVTSGTTALAITCFRSEDSEKGSTPSDGAPFAAMYDNFNYDASNGAIQSYWSDNYNMIHHANTVIADMDARGDLDATEQILYGEAHFFRAFGYLNLVCAFGEVPLIDFKIENAADANVPKSTVTEIYSLIDGDLTIAERSLPPTWESRYVGRLTYGAARALHARAYMMRNDWPNMYRAAVDVMDTQLYNLNTPFEDIFREEYENGPESVWEIQCTATVALPADNNIGSQFAQVQGCRGAGNFDLGWGWHAPTQLLAEAFEPGDPRKDATLLYFVRAGESWPADYPPNGNAPYNEKLVAAADMSCQYLNKKAYTNPALRTKYGNRYGYWFNIRMIRYADVVLMAAEAACEMGGEENLTAAKEYLEMVRARARGTNPDILPEVTTDDQDALRTAIRHERRIELAMEPGRFYDLVRWGTANEVLTAAGKHYEERFALLPLPQNEVDQSNGVLVQNPNYAN